MPDLSLVFGEGLVFAKRYRVVRLIGAGGMGAVYEVVQIETDRRRALKVMLPHVLASDLLRERFRREARLSAHIDSAFVVDVLDAGVDETTGIPYLVMELLAGEDLGRRSRRGPLTGAEVVKHLHQVALALDKSHAAGIIHRDLKPENIFVVEHDDGSSHVKILDFGIAKLVQDGASASTATAGLGTPSYMAPEQVDHLDGGVSTATDIYALGMIGYTLCVGRRYWHEEAAHGNVFAIAAAVRDGPSEPATARARRTGVTLPAAFDRWFARATARDPDDRFSSACDAVAALAVALGQAEPIAARRARPASGPLARQPLRALIEAAEDDSGTTVLTASSPPPGSVRSSAAARGMSRGVVIVAAAAVLTGSAVAGSSLLRRPRVLQATGVASADTATVARTVPPARSPAAVAASAGTAAPAGADAPAQSAPERAASPTPGPAAATSEQRRGIAHAQAAKSGKRVRTVTSRPPTAYPLYSRE
jgi:serine/threonine-protein kinase